MFRPDAISLRAAMHSCFEAPALAQGQVYFLQRRISDCAVQWAVAGAWRVTATVRGSSPSPYHTLVEIRQLKGGIELAGSCSCAAKTNCKHAAAVLFYVSDRAETWFQLHGIPVKTAGPPVVTVSTGLPAGWLSWLHHAEELAPRELRGVQGVANPPQRLLFFLKRQNRTIKIELGMAPSNRSGNLSRVKMVSIAGLFFSAGQPQDIDVRDRELVAQVLLAQRAFHLSEAVLEGVLGVELLQKLLASGRCYWRAGKQELALVSGEARPAKPVWVMGEKGAQQAKFEIEPPASVILPLHPPWYLDDVTGECGPLETGMPAALSLKWLEAPPVAPEQAELVSVELTRRLGATAVPPPRPVAVETVLDVKPVPTLRLFSTELKLNYWMYYRGSDANRELEVNLASLGFDYGGIQIRRDLEGRSIDQYHQGKLRRIPRDPEAEARALQRLTEAGFGTASEALGEYETGKHATDLCMEEPDDWLGFVMSGIPKLRAEGWRVETDESFQFRLAEPQDWYTDALRDGGNDWFGVELGVMLDGQKVNLLPVLVRLLRLNPQRLSGAALAQLPDDALIPVPLPDGRTLPFPIARARQILGVMIELLEPDALDKRGRLKLSKLRAAELAGGADWRWLGDKELRQLSERLRSFKAITPVAPSPKLRATLRPYQQEGLDWLQFLREYELAGVLADDMGLGKTVQALAHLLSEKEAGRMDLPSLVVAPTSLMTNWRQETERFTPDLRVLVLHGAARKQHFARLAEYDLIVTSYPLLPRDQAQLLEQPFHYVILDEAQFIKNPRTQYAQVACALKARHRLCLTGTPMENHLGELWSLFHFLLPGFLGDEIRFNSVFRRPIEKGRSEERRLILAHRVRPFVLRRKKDEVVKELPAKTEIVQNVELTGAQRDLYESVRLAMHERVKAEVDRKGLSRAHIIILDALLKLRQICCHPRLLKIPAAQAIKESAKLDLLMDLVPEMIEEGRRILLFSQFTSMLAIIEESLTHQKIPYVLLTGDTNDRATPVNRFQAGEVPLFLISLKAGGTGLNLTAADTVIHYDPWWNPAVENQATDRAHRIGQDKKVFVYKLMTVGTVEEKIGQMQARKRELVEGLLDAERSQNLKLTPDDLDVLFAPIG